MALVSCPTASIGTLRKPSVSAARAFPAPFDGEVYFCGYASPDSYGASSWLVRRAAGNVLVDSPRAARPLLERITVLGGVAVHFLTHRDDVADHAQLHRRFGTTRVLHADDIGAGTRDVEHRLVGRDPVALADDLLAIPVPGHTRGSTALLYRNHYLFTGDHLWGFEGQDGLDAARDVCWYSWPEQLRSLERLLDFDFAWVLPGHGMPLHAASPGAMRDKLATLLRRLRT